MCVFFLGTQTKDFFEDLLGGTHKDSFDYQFKTIHDYSLIGGLDGLIINYGTLGLQLKNETAERFALKFNSIPTVFLTEIVHSPNCHSLICDNKNGIHMVMEHLINEHHCRKILFVAGPSQNTDANERKNTYLERMAAHNLPVTPQMIAQGDYSEFVDRQVSTFWMIIRMHRPSYLQMMKWHFPDTACVNNVVLKLARISSLLVLMTASALPVWSLLLQPFSRMAS